jgi:hypothetical protein
MVTPELSANLQALIDRHPRDLSIILNALGIDEEPSPEAMRKAYAKHGENLTNLLAQLPEENFQGSDYYRNLLDTEPVSMMTGTAQQTESTPKKESMKWVYALGAWIVIMLIIALIVIRSFKQ